MTRKTLFTLATLSFVALTACQTVEGAGRDIQNAGAAVTDAAQEAQY